MEQRSRTLVEVSLIQESMLSVMSYLASGQALRLWNLTFPTTHQCFWSRSWSVKIIQSCFTSLLQSEHQLFDPVGWSRRSELSSIGTSGSCVRVSPPSVIQQLWLVQVNRAQIVLDLSMSVPWAASSQLLVQFLLLVPEFPPSCGKRRAKKPSSWEQPTIMIHKE